MFGLACRFRPARRASRGGGSATRSSLPTASGLASGSPKPGAEISNTSPALVRMPAANDSVAVPKAMDVDVTRPAEIRIFEMMGFEVGDGMRHVRFAGQERLLEDHRLAAADARDAAHVVRQVAEQQLRSERARPELGVGKEQIVPPLHDVIGEFVEEREADPPGLAVLGRPGRCRRPPAPRHRPRRRPARSSGLPGAATKLPSPL